MIVLDLSGEIRLGIMNAISNGKSYQTVIRQQDYFDANFAAHAVLNELGAVDDWTVTFTRTGDNGYALCVRMAEDD